MAQASAGRKHILVTGGAGFVGSHLVDRLLAAGHRVLCVDNLHTGAAANIAHLRDNPAFTFRRHDITEPLDVQVDLIYNLACPASPVHYQRDPIRTTKSAVLGAINMLELAKRLKCRVFQASTSEVYGDPTIHPQPETYWGNVNPIGPRSCYDEGKRCAEALFFDYRRQYGVDIRVARLFNTYGPRMHPNDGRVVSNFVNQALRGDAITLYGDGLQTRSFCYVDDTVAGIVGLAESEAADAGPVNIGNPEEIAIGRLAEKIVAMTASASPIVYRPIAADDPRKRKPDIEKARRLLNWEPAVTLDRGLERTIDHFRALMPTVTQSAG